jgi:hypothetical protein
VSFVGMLRPLVRPGPAVPLGQGEPVSYAPVATLTAGFTGSAVLVFGAVTVAGAAFGVDRLPVTTRVWLAVALCAAMCVLDAISLRAKDFCKLTRRRQTPKNLIYRYGHRVGPLLWGLDTGLTVTTIRVSAVTWAALSLAVLNLGPWWLGLAYGLGFCLPVAGAAVLPRRRPDAPDGSPREPQWIVLALTHSRRAMQFAALAVLVVGTAVLAVVLVVAGP